ncbi:S9 family peptidase [Aquabacterium sp.]|uniref:S9 family peptidase n=1 Tax=Aquabacterium sp. TaxID=1872578 RepID=UPI002BB93FAD|nr:S9 family peptidase [Aquabacterium sp.]HSW07876.1 S9 family peptidase [Aquabacterium sp.]
MNRRVIHGLLAALGLAGAVAVSAQTGPAPAASASSAPVSAAPARAERLPIQAFAHLPLLQQVALSPDGQRFAALMNVGDNTVLITRELTGGEKSRAILKTDNRQFRFGWLRWGNNDRVVFSVVYPGRRGWTELTETRLLSIHRDGGGLVNLVRHSRFDEHRRPAQFQDQVIDWMPDDGQHVLLQLADDGTLDPAIYRVNIETGQRRLVEGARADVTRWITDRTHRARVAVRQTGTRVVVELCDADGQNWRRAWTYELFSPDSVRPLGFGKDADRLYISANHEGRAAVFEVDLRDPALPRRLLLSDPRHDLGGELMLAPQTQEAIGVRLGLLGDAAAGFWQADAKGLLQAIDKALPDRHNELLQFSADGTRYLLRSSGNGVAPHYLVGFRQRGELSPLGEAYPELAGAPLARKRSLTIKARDGTLLPSLLTLPVGAAPRGLPTVILPHGGPISLDTVEFDPWVQFLANRGYAVLQVNFRGSAGFGHAHMSAGLKRWGLEMQDDLSDAVHWLNGQNIADPARVCIVGASYGGFAALMGAVKTPELYRCVLSFAGVSDLLELASRQRDFLHGEAVFSRQIGSTWSDRDQLKATSPRRLAEQVRAPVLLIHGTADRSVPFEQSELMADALKRAGKRYTLIKQEDGDHHLSIQAHRLQFFQLLEAFLAEHLGNTQQP